MAANPRTSYTSRRKCWSKLVRARAKSATCPLMSSLKRRIATSSSNKSSERRHQKNMLCFIFLPARRYSRAVFAVIACPSVRLSVCHKPVLYKHG